MKNRENDLVVGIGEVLWDLLPEGKKLGGAPANFAYHVTQFGLGGCVVSAVGNDIPGVELCSALNDMEVEMFLSVVGYPTGTVKVDVDDAGIPCYDITKDVAWDNIPYCKQLEDIAASTCAVCFGSLAQRNAVSRHTITRFIDAVAARKDALIVFDINLRQDFYTKEILTDSLERCNVLKINNEELEDLSRLLGYDNLEQSRVCRVLMERYNLKLLILTCGVDGSYVFTPEKVSFQPTPRVEVVDTVGAGDSFTAAFVASILRGMSVEQAHVKAVETSAFVCSSKGAMPVLPSEIVG